MQSTGARSQRGFSYSPSTSSMRAMYSSSNSATHHIFSPPRLPVVAFQQNPDGFSPYSWYQLAFDHFFGQPAHRPARPTWQPPPALTALHPSVAGPRLAAPSALAATRRSTTDLIAADLAGKVEPEALCLYPCHSYKA